jgi:hypothetical protein
MMFLDEEARHQYHKAPALLQVICQIFENFLARWHLQCEVIEVEEHGCRLGVHGLDETINAPEGLQEAVIMINKQFQRMDKKPTMGVLSIDTGLVNIYITESKDFLTMH